MKRKTKNHIIRIFSARFWQIFPKTKKLRFFVYKRVLKLEHRCSIHTNVHIGAHHEARPDFERVNENGLIVGKRAVFNDNIVLDTTGNLIIGDRVGFAESVVVYTHEHQRVGMKKVIVPSTLKIDDDVLIGAHAIILDSCPSIGRCARVGAGSVVRTAVPPYAIVIGNPAKIIGFMFSPSEIIEREKELYEEKDRLPLELLEKNYQRYFIERRAEIKSFIKSY